MTLDAIHTRTTSHTLRTQTRQRLNRLLPLVILLIASLPALIPRLGVYPPVWFDEGYKMNAARTLLERGVYGTYTVEGYIPFDPGTSSGPVDLVAAALSFKLFGIGVAEARVSVVVFSLLAVFGLYVVTTVLYGERAALFITLALLATPLVDDVRFLLMGRQVLSETPALALILPGLWLWFRSWEHGGWSASVVSGIALGLGLLSKTQIAIALVPALGLVGLARGLARRSERLKTLSPIVIAVAVVGLWSLIGRFSTPDSLRQENGEMLIEAIRTNLLTDLFGRTLSPSALALIVIMVAGGLCGAWRLRSLAWPVRRHPASIRPASDADWAEAAMTVFVLFSAAWFALISIGWPRYAYAGVNVALLLLGKTAWDLFQAVRKRVAHARPAIARRAYPLALTGLVIGGVLTNVYPVLQFDKDSQAQQAVAYLDANVPPGAVIETWDWELSALSLHSEFHHPHQRYLFEAIRQFSHDQIAFDLNYDLLQEDPDYLVLGPFSIWSHIYNDHDVDRYFVELTHIGDYEIYRRIR